MLAAAAAGSPLKDAVKFYGAAATAAGEAAAPADAGLPSKGVELWTFRDVDVRSRALAAGLGEAGFTAGDKIAVCLPPESQEYITLLLAAVNCGVTIVAVDPPASTAAVDVSAILKALSDHKPRALFVWHGYRAAGGGGALVPAIFPKAAAADAAGTAGLVPISGRPISSAEHPYLRCVVHTGDEHVRGATAFKSLLVYSDSAPVSKGSASSTVLVEAATGRELTQRALLADARTVGEKLKLVSDVYAKNGRVVLRPSASLEAASAVVSALMHESLLITSTAARTTATAEAEQALVV
jgi:AMP-binding enzyme